MESPADALTDHPGVAAALNNLGHTLRATNQLIRDEIARDPNQIYIDVFTPMLGAGGRPKPELFLADSLHMTRAGYTIWTERVAPVLK